MSVERRPSVSDAVRRAVERTYSATVDSAGLTREWALEVVDEVARRSGVGGRRATEVRDRLVEVLLDMRLATDDDVKALQGEIDSLRQRIDVLEQKGLEDG